VNAGLIPPPTTGKYQVCRQLRGAGGNAEAAAHARAGAGAKPASAGEGPFALLEAA